MRGGEVVLVCAGRGGGDARVGRQRLREDVWVAAAAGLAFHLCGRREARGEARLDTCRLSENVLNG